MYLHGGQPLSVGIFCAFRHNIKVFGVVIDGTFSVPRVVIRRTFPGKSIVIVGTFPGIFVVISSTIFYSMYCYRRHSSPQISRQLPRLRLLSAAHFPAQRHRAGIVIHGTIPGFTGIFPHFFKSHRVVIRHTIRGGAGCVAGVVISGTFCGMGCYPWHIFHFVDFLLCVLLSAA